MKIEQLKKARLLVGFIVLNLFLFQPAFIYAVATSTSQLPQNPTVVAGAAPSITTSGNGMTINASGPGILNWQSHNIGSNNYVNYNLNGPYMSRVTGGNPTSIMGSLNVQGGPFFLVNPSGIIFTGSSSVNAPGLVASSLDISDQNFMSGQYNFYQNGNTAAVINRGNINANNGYVVLLSNAVNNSGTITANLGEVLLAAGNKMTLALNDASGISVVIGDADQASVYDSHGKKIANAIKNSGSIIANGGKVILNARVLNNVFDHAVNNAGLIQANTLVDHNGTIELMADGGTLIASAGSVTSAKASGDNGNGGNIVYKSTGNTVIEKGAVIDVSGGKDTGNAGSIELSAGNNFGLYSTSIYTNAAVGYQRGSILIDPQDITIQSGGTAIVGGGNPQEAYADNVGSNIVIDPAALSSLTASQIYLQATGNIFINSPIDLNASLKLEAQNNIQVNANVTTQGQSITLTANSEYNGNGALTMAHGVTIASNGGDIALSSGGSMNVAYIDAGGGDVNLTSSNGAILDNGSYVSAGDLTLNAQNGIGTNAGIFTHANNIDAYSTFGDINIAANSDMTVGMIDAVNGNVNLAAVNGSILSNNSNITADNVNLTALNSIGSNGGALEVNAATEINAVTTNGDITLSSTGDLQAGVINAAGGAGDVSLTSAAAVKGYNSYITASNLAINAQYGIGNDMGLLTNVNSISGSTVFGPINITETHAVELTDLTSDGGPINIYAGGTLTADRVNSNGGDIGLTGFDVNLTQAIINTGGGSLGVRAYGGSIDLEGSNIITDGGALNLNALNSIIGSSLNPPVPPSTLTVPPSSLITQTIASQNQVSSGLAKRVFPYYPLSQVDTNAFKNPRFAQQIENFLYKNPGSMSNSFKPNLDWNSPSNKNNYLGWFLLLLAAVLIGASAALRPNEVHPVVAKVGPYAITHNEFEQAYRNSILSLEDSAAARKAFLKDMMTQKAFHLTSDQKSELQKHPALLKRVIGDRSLLNGPLQEENKEA